MSRTQLNVRVSKELEQAIDERRVQLRAKLGVIPTRSDVLRLALEAFLGLEVSVFERDGRTTAGPDKRRMR
jgi:hypothetical protein